MSARWEIDLSPGTAATPSKRPNGTLSMGGAGWRGTLQVLSRRRRLPNRMGQASRALTGGCSRGKRPPFGNGSSRGIQVKLVKADLGTKRVCPSCGARFYDLSKRPIECPKCAFTFEPEAMYKQRRPRQPEPAPVVQPAPEVEEEEVEEEIEEAEEEAVVERSR